MGLIDKLKGEFIDIVEWTDDTRDTIVWRFPRHGHEIKMGAQLTVREGQVAVFVHEGQLTDVFTPGRYVLETRNLPVTSTLRGWKHGFHSPFKSEVYFVTTRTFGGLKWGTSHPVLMRDADFGVVRVRAFGTYTVRVDDAPTLLRELVGTDPDFRADEVSEYIRCSVVSRVVTALANSGIAVLDLAGHQDEISLRLAAAVSDDLKQLGLRMPGFTIESISLPPEVEAAIDTRSRIGALGSLEQYAKILTADAIPLAAANPGGLASAGVGIVVGTALAAQATEGLQTGATTPAPPALPASVPPHATAAAEWYVGVDGEPLGPFSVTELQVRLAAGSVRTDTLVWCIGMTGWAPLEQMPGLLHRTTPPPLPQT